MPVQQQMSSFAKKLGGRVAAANQEHKDKPVDTGNRRLPAGIRDGVAKLSALYTKEYADDTNGPGTKGQSFFRASAITMGHIVNGALSEEVNGEKIAGIPTQVIIPLCDMPAKGQRKAKSFSDNWYEFQNLFKLLGIAPPNETPQTDPTGQKTEAYYFAAMKTLTDPVRTKTNPIYISFSTRGWTPPATPQQPKPTEMVFETWHGLAEWNGKHNPAAGVTESTSSAPPPGQNFNEFVPPPPSANGAPQESDPTDEVMALVEVAMSDPNGETEEGAAAGVQLEDMAVAAGWTKEQVVKADNWSVVGGMILSGPGKEVDTADLRQPPPAPSAPTVGSRWKFAKRTKDGSKLKNNKGEEFPAQEAEVVAVNPDARDCTVKTTKDGKVMMDIWGKQPIAVKFDWLEPL